MVNIKHSGILVLYTSQKRELDVRTGLGKWKEMSQFGTCALGNTMSLSTYTTPSGQPSCFSHLILDNSNLFVRYQDFYYRRYTQLLLFSRQVANCSIWLVATEMYLENSQILPHNRSPPSNGFVSYWLTPATGDCSSCAWKMLNKQRAIGQKFYGMNVLVVSNNLDADRGYLMGIYGYRKDNTKPFVKYHGSHGGKKPCNPWATKAIALNISILAFTRRMGGSPLSMGAHEVLKVIWITTSRLWLSRSLTLGNWIRSWLSTISPIRQ